MKCARSPALRFSPTAWAKLVFLRDYGETEVGGFGIAPSDDLLFIEDVQLVNQKCNCVHVSFDDESVADFFDTQVDSRRRPEQFARIWLHTHPADCARPSSTDEETFARVFGKCEWAVMAILAREGQTFARLQFNVGPGGSMEIPVDVDYRRPFIGSDLDAWEREYVANVQPEPTMLRWHEGDERQLESPFCDERNAEWYDDWMEYVDDADFEQVKEGADECDHSRQSILSAR